MMEFHEVLRIGVEEDLLPLSALLYKREINHRIFEEGGQQVLKVEKPEHIEEVQDLYRQWQAGELKILLRRKARDPSTITQLKAWQDSPVTLTLIVFSIIGFALVYLRPLHELASWFTFLPLGYDRATGVLEQMQGQYWRAITPAFLHMGWLHITFNCLWMWDLGTKVERVMGRFNMFMLFVVIALVSNVTQFMSSGSASFGGLSGVVYGLLGFSWMGAYVQPRWGFRPSGPIMFFMVGWMFACMFGIVEGLGFGKIANAAHASGLACGAMIGLVFGLFSRLTDNADDEHNADTDAS